MNEFAFKDDIDDALGTIQRLLRMTEDERMARHLVGARRHLERILHEWGGEAALQPVREQPLAAYLARFQEPAGALIECHALAD